MEDGVEDAYACEKKKHVIKTNFDKQQLFLERKS